MTICYKCSKIHRYNCGLCRNPVCIQHYRIFMDLFHRRYFVILCDNHQYITIYTTRVYQKYHKYKFSKYLYGLHDLNDITHIEFIL